MSRLIKNLIRTSLLALMLMFLFSVQLPFVTAAGPVVPISFGTSTLNLNGNGVTNPTTMDFGPDGRLYVGQQTGVIRVYTISRTAANTYTTTAVQTINSIRDLPNRNDSGVVNTTIQRQLTGLIVRGTASNPVIYATSSDWRRGTASDTNLDTNSGVITRLTWNGSIWTVLDLVRGLPRSEESHSINGLQMDTANNRLLVAIGSNTNMGAPTNSLAFLPEYAYSGAVLSVDLAAIGTTTYIMPTLDDPTRNNVNGITDPAAPGYTGIDVSDPWGGNDGLNQAKLTPTSPVQIYMPGFRNPYDLVLTQSGRIYASDNGPNQGLGGFLIGEGTTGTCTNQPNENNSATRFGHLHLVTQGAYGGHPNPIRANANAGWTSATGAYMAAGSAGMPIDWPPVPASMLDIRQCDFRGSATSAVNNGASSEDGSIAGWNFSTNGITEYTASNFNSQMKGNLLLASYNNSIQRVELNAAGTAAIAVTSLAAGFGTQPIDVVAQSDFGKFPGTVWVANYITNTITVLEPSDYGGVASGTCDASDSTTLDSDLDGFKNADEIDNGTSPCSSASKPSDADGDSVSDLNDNDDDNDTILDISDAFQVDANNGLTTNLPMYLSFDPTASDFGVGLLNSGWTGMMVNGTTDYLTMYDPTQMTAGGVTKTFTVDNVTAGDALASNNNQQYAFQKGINVDSSTADFTVRTRVNGPFFNNLTPSGVQSLGLFIGTGTQDNYVKLVLNSNSGAGGIQLVRENNGTTTVTQFSNSVLSSSYINLMLSVSPFTGQVQARYSNETGVVTNLGAPFTLSGPVRNAVQQANKALAVGIISTSRGGAPFTAQWDDFEVNFNRPGVLSVTPGAYDFSFITTGQNAYAALVLKNEGVGTDASIQVSGVTLTGNAAFTISSAPPFFPITLAPGQSEVITIRFAPTIDGSVSTLFRATHNGVSGQSTAGLSGSGQSFGPAIFRVNAGGLQVTDPLGGIPWVKDQTGTGNRSPNYVTITSDNIGSGSINTNTTTAPAAIFTTERYDAVATPEMSYAFGVTAGQYEVRLYFAETSAAAQAAGRRLFNVDIEGKRVLTNFDQWSTALAETANGRNGFVRKFPVTISGTGQSIDILFTHGAIDNPAIKGIEIVPKNVTGLLIASPGSLNFSTVTVGATSAPQTVRLSNSAGAGGPTIAVSALNITGTGMQLVSPPTTPFNLTPGQFVDLSVRFAPTNTTQVSGTLSVTHNGTNSPSQITLTGRGTQPPVLPSTLSPDSDPLVFNDVQPGLVDTEVLELNNLIVAGNPSITVSSVTITGPNAASFTHNFSGPVTLTSGQALALNLTHNPMVAGTNTATMTVVHSGSNSPLVIALSGDSTPGILPSLNVNFQPANFVPPTGYVRDFGEAYGPRTLANQGSGLTYGWVIPGTHTPRNLSIGGSPGGNGRRRTMNSDPRLDTVFFMQYTGTNGTALPGAWEVAVPNGAYLVEIGIGDPQLNSGAATINVEGVNFVSGYTQTPSDLWRIVTKSVTVNDGRMTVDAIGGDNARIMYLTFQPMNVGQPYITGVNPPNGATNVNTSSGIAFYVYLPTSGMGVDKTTLDSTTVKIFETNTGTPVAAKFGTSGGNDDITVQPDEYLSPNTSYTIQITAGVKDLTGTSFVPYTMNFTTGTASGGSPLVGVVFEKVVSGAAEGNLYTSLTMGPDGRLYAASLTGTIYSWAINPDGTLTGLRTINNYAGRAVIGLTFSPGSTATNMELWVTNNFAALNAAPNFSGRIGALSSTNGVTWTNVDYIDGMPRAVRDHMTNSLAFGPDGGLYLTNGSVSAMGDRDNAWGNEPETILSGGLMRIDVGLLKAYYAAHGTLDVSTGTPEASGDLLDANNAQLGDPRLSTTNTDLADPNKYYNPQAPNAPLTIYATGMRNAYDLVWHSGGSLFVPTNGSAGGGNTPPTPTILPVSCQYRTDKAINGNYTGPQVPASEPPTQSDYLFRVVQNGFYGHPNPTRCEWVLYGGNPTAGTDPAQVGNHYPVGTLPDRNYRGYAYDMGMNASSNGVIEYKNDAFGGILTGRLMIVRYSLFNDIVVLQVDASGNVVQASVGMPGLKNFIDPLDLTEDISNGNLYVSDLADGGGKIILVRPLGANVPRIELEPEELFFADQIGGSPSGAQSITVSNTGTGILNLTDITVTGPFQLVGTPPVSVPPFSSVTVDVTYQATAAGVQTGAVTFTSNATNTPTASVLLSGGGFSVIVDNTEPSLQLIVNTYHIPVNIGDDNSDTVVIHSNETQQRAPILGQEISVESFQRYEDGNVEIQVLAVFGPQNSGGSSGEPVAKVGWYISGLPATREQLFQIDNTTPQTMAPKINGVLSFDPGTNAFGFWSNWPFFGTRNIYSEDPLNTFGNAIPHHMRVYQLLDSNGVVVPNSFVVATEEHVNVLDYNDLVMIVRNVKPAQTDITPPTVSISLGGSQQSPGVYINQVTVTVNATDTESGIASIEYSLDGGPFQIYTGPFVVTAATAHSVIARATDLVDLQTTTPTTNFSIVTIPSSGIVRYENRDWVTLNSLNIPNAEYFNTWLEFSNLHSSVDQRQSHNFVTLRIHNDGTTPLQILSLELDTPARWVLPDNPVLPRTVAAGTFYDLRVQFIENGATMAVFAGTLKVTTTDPTNPVQIVQLRGAYQIDTGGALENDFYDLFRMFGTSTNVPTSLTSQYIPMGDEVLSYTWKKVPGIASIYTRQAVSYQGFTASSFSFMNGSTVLASMIPSNQNTQSVLPVKTNGGTDYVEMFFTPAVANFVMNAATYRTDRCATGTQPCTRQGLRVWPVYNPDGELVPNLYHLGQDFVGSTGCGNGSANCDYQDNMYFVYGIMPTTVTPAFSITKTGASTQSLINTDFTYTINVKNTTIFPHPAVVTDTLPAGLTYVSSSSTVGSCNFVAPTVTCNLDQMNGAAEAVITLVVRGTLGYKDNTATLTSGSYTVSEAERTLFYEAATPPGSITFNKNAVPDSFTSFSFTGDVSDFMLTDDGIHNGTPLIYNVNFGDKTVPPPGFDLGDRGLPYTTAKGYGWVTEASRNLNNPVGIDIAVTGRDRAHELVSPEQNTLLNMQYPGGDPGAAAWRYDLPNGTYNITVSVGDATSGNGSTSHTVRANGTNIITNFIPTGGAGESIRFQVATATITVTNQRLILDAVGGTNTKINYVKIRGTGNIGRTRHFPSLIPGVYNVNEIVPVGWRQESFLCSGNSTTNNGTGVTITLAPGQNIICNVTNSRISGPAVDIEVTPDSQIVTRNSIGTFTVTVTNTGTENLTGLQTTSPLATCTQVMAGTLQPGDIWSYACTVNPVTEAITNTMSVVATGTSANATDTDTAILTMVSPSLTISMTPDSQTTNANNTVLFYITVQNTGDVPLTDVVVTDPNAALCARTIVTGATTMAPGASVPYTCMPVVGTTTMTNVATVTGKYGTQTFTATDSSVVAVNGVTYSSAIFRVNAGGPQVAANDGGLPWTIDTSGSKSPYLTSNPTGGQNNVATQSNAFTNTTSAPNAIFPDERSDPAGNPEMSWEFSVNAGTYEVRLYFVEHSRTSTGTRVFDVKIEDVTVLDDFDIWRDSGSITGTGAIRYGIVRRFPVTITGSNQKLDIDFFRVVENPSVRAIEIVPTTVTQAAALGATPTNINFGNGQITRTSAAVPVDLKHLGLTGANINVTNVTITGTDASSFGVTPTGAMTLSFTPNQLRAAALNVVFKPTTLGNKSATLQITHSGANSPLLVYLTGVAVPLVLPDLVATPNPVTINQVENTAPLVTNVPLSATEGSATFTIDNASFPAWLQVSPLTGTIPTSGNVSLTFTTNVTGLALGTYNYSIPISAPGYDPLLLPIVFNVNPYVHPIHTTAETGGVISWTGGTIDGGGNANVRHNTNATFNFTSQVGYAIDDVLIDGVSVGVVSTYTFSSVIADGHTIEIQTHPVAVFTITATAQTGGTVTPIGPTQVNQDSQPQFNFYPDMGYMVNVVLVDGAPVTVTGAFYKFPAITANHTLDVSFKLLVPSGITITADNVPNGPGVFDFTINDGGPFADIFSLVDNGGPTNVKTYSNIQPGTYTLVGTIPAGKVFNSLVCTGAPAVTNMSTGTAVITVAAGSNVNCLYKATEPPNCSPYSASDCATLPVPITSNFCLSFDAAVGGLSGTGFTMVDKPSVNKYPATPSVPLVPGYEPGNISLTGGHLVITSTRGMAYQTPTQNAANNTQVNALGVAVDPNDPFIISLDVINSPFPDAAQNEQSGIWFGLNDDNFVKLVVVNRSGVGNGMIELRREVSGLSLATDPVDVRQVNVTNVNTATVTLEMRLDPIGNQISGKYTSSTGETGIVGPLTVPAAFFAGQMLTDTVTGPVSFAGLYASSRFNTTTPALPFTFDNFCIKPNTNQVPVATADSITVGKGNTATVLDSGATSVLANDSDPEGDALIAVLGTGPVNGALTLNANGTFSYTHNNGASTTDSFTYKVSDGQGQSNTVTVNIVIVVTCSPYSTGACPTIPVPITSQFCLSFDAPAGGLKDTGFTMVDKPSVNKYPTPASQPSYPGYEPSLINVTGGQLVITSTRGMAYQTPTQNAANNTQVNALGVGVRPTTPFIISTQVINAPFPDAAQNEQSGVWFGLNDDNYVKLVVVNRAGVGNGMIELRREVGGVSLATDPVDVRQVNVTNVNTATITLEMRLNPTTNEVSGKYTSSTGETGVLGPLTVAPAFFAGVNLSDGATNSVSFAGIFASSRFNTITPALPFTFDNFCVKPNVNQAPVAVADSITVAKGTTATVLDSAATSVLANDTDAEGDPLTAVLVTGPAHGTLTLNANGTFSYTHNDDAAITDSFTYKVSDGQGQSNTVTVSISIVVVCSPYSNGPCTGIPVTYTPNFCLSFNAAAGGLSNTGFTMVDKPSVHKYPVTPSVSAIPGYEPANISITGGQLVITATRGSFNQTQTESNTNNTQVNALGVGINPTGPIIISTQVINSPLPDTSNGEQSGLWFGLDEDNYVRLAVSNFTGVGLGQIELRREIGGVSSGATVNTRLANITNVNTSTITLEMRLNPLTNEVTAKYTSTNGETGVLGPLVVPASFFAGQMMPDTATGPVAFAGVFTTNRFNTGAALPFTFDNFCIKPNTNQAPVAVADSMTVAKGTAQTTLDSGATSVLVNDTDAEGDALTAMLVTAPVNGTLTLNANGTFIYTHDNSATTTDSFTYKVSDGQGQSNTVTVPITIYVACTPYTLSPCSSIPVTTTPATCLTFGGAAGGLSNTGFTMVDTHSTNRYPATPSVPALPGYEPANISVTGGRLVLTATRGSLNQTQTEGVGNNTQVNALGVAINPTGLTTITVQVINPTFPDGSSGEQAGIWFGLNEDNNVRFVVANRAGTDMGDIELRREIGGLTSGATANTRLSPVTNITTATITLEMRLDPINNQVSGKYVSSTGETAVLGPLTVPASFFAGQMLTDGATGPVSFAGLFTTNRNNAGTPLVFTFDNFCVQPNSNVVPTAVADSMTVAKGTAQTTLDSGATSVLANDTDPEGDALTAAVVANPANGTLTLNANGTFTYTHNNSATTTDSFTYRASDGQGQSNTVTVSINIYVACTPLSLGPCSTIPVTITPPTCLTFTAAGSGLAGTGFTMVANRTVLSSPATTSVAALPGYEPNNLALTGGQLVVTASRGTFHNTTNNQINGLGVGANSAIPFIVMADIVNSPFPTSNLSEQSGLWYGLDQDNMVRLAVNNRDGAGNGTVELRYEIAGVSTATSLNVTNVNTSTITLKLILDPITNQARGEFTSTSGETGTLGPVAVNSTFFAGQPLPDASASASFAGIFATSRNNGSLPALQFTFDNFCVRPVSAPPVAVADAITVAEGGTATTLSGGGNNLLTNDSDPENDPLTAAVVANPTNGTLTLNANGTFSYTHNGSETTSDSFTYRANDGMSNSNTVTVTITVTPVNDAPVAVDDTYTVNEDAVLTVTAANKVTLNDTDAENSPLTVALVANVTHGTLALSADGTFIYTPTANYSGTDSFTYRANDGTVSGNTVTVTITITGVNDAPVAVANALTVAEGGTATTLTGGATSVLINDTDVESNPLTAVLVTGPANGSLTLNADGTFSYTHNGSETTTDSFTYKANDGSLDSNVVAVTITITPVNDAPSAVDDNITVAEGGTATTLTGGATSVRTNDIDPEGATLVVSLVTGPTNGSLTLNANGTFSYTHNGSETTSDSFTYRVNDGTSNSNTATVTITVTPLNDAPVAVADTTTVAEGGTATTLTGGVTSVLANDTDVESNSLTAILITSPANGALIFNADGTFSYTHNGSETTSDSFSYKANDGLLDSNVVTVTITVTGVNDAPVAVNDAYAVAEGGTLTVNLANRVTLNDTDAENNALTAVLDANPTNGTLTLNANGTFTYVHNGSETTTDSFTYRANDGTSSSNVATVTITITGVNDAPVAVADALTVAEGGTATTLTGGATSVLTNDTDPESNPLTAALVTGPANGTLTLNANGTFSYVHNGSETTSDSFTYRANDGTVNSNTVTVTITITPVNDAPVAANDSYSVDEDTTLTVTAANKITLNDTDAENNALTAVLVANVTHGTLTLNADGTFTYTPVADYSGPDSFTYRANDGTSNSNVATVNITVGNVNDAPVAVADALTVAEGGTATTLTGGATNVLTNDTDAESNPLTAVLVTGPANGTLTLNANGTFSYVHNGSETTTDSFTYQANDGLSNSNIVTVTITITPVNDAPVAVNDTYSVDEDTTLTVTVANSVLVNDTDAEGNALTVILVAGPAHGTLTLNANGTFTYTPTANYNGPDSFTYTANDGTISGNTATVNITVVDTNEAPVAVADALTVAEGGTATTLTGGATGVLANDTDVENSPLTAAVVTAPTNGTLTLNANGTFSYTHNGSETTSDSFTYKANDGTTDSNTVTVTITVTPVNDAPVAVNDTYAVNEDTTLTVTAANKVTLNDTDAENSALSAVLVTGPTHGTLTLNADGTFTYVPTANYNGPDSFTYKANDGTVSGNTATVTITVNAIGDAPTGVADAYNVVRGGVLSVNAANGVLKNDTDVDGDALSAISIFQMPTHGTLTFNADGSFTYNHDGSAPTSDTFVYVLADTDPATPNVNVTVTLTIGPNTPPVATADALSVVNGGTVTVLTGGATSVLANDTDTESNPLTASLVTGPTKGSLTLNANGTFSYTHNGSPTAPDSFSYQASDGMGLSNIVTVSITVTGTAATPVAVNDTGSVNAGASVLIPVTVNDTFKGTPVVSIVSAPSQGTAVVSGTNIQFTAPASLTMATVTFTYKITDISTLASNTATVTIVYTVSGPSLYLDATQLTVNPATGSNVQFSIIVRNNGTVNLTDIYWMSSGGTTACTYANFDLAVGAERTFTCQDNNVQVSYDHTFLVENTAHTAGSSEMIRVLVSRAPGASAVVATPTPTVTPLTAGTYDSSDSRIRYAGSWTGVTTNNVTYRRSTTVNDRLAFTVSNVGQGGQLVLYRMVGKGMGTMEVCFGTTCQFYSNEFGTTVASAALTLALPVGETAVEIRVGASSDVRLDAVELRAGQPVTTTPVPVVTTPAVTETPLVTPSTPVATEATSVVPITETPVATEAPPAETTVVPEPEAAGS